MTYEQWKNENVVGNPMGLCGRITLRMVAEFPELKRVRGHYFDVWQGRRSHWWCVAPDGSIVDPTKAQFQDQHGEYEPLPEGIKEPTGKCPNCGDLCYDGNSTCTPGCYREYAEYLTRMVPLP